MGATRNLLSVAITLILCLPTSLKIDSCKRQPSSSESEFSSVESNIPSSEEDTSALESSSDDLSTSGESSSSDEDSSSIEVSKNLIIATNVEDILKGKLSFCVDFKGMARSNMIAVTHDSNIPGTFLKYLTNPHAVDHITGNAIPGATLEFTDVPITNNEAYFIDYTVYLATTFEALEISALNASITLPYAVDEAHPYFNAASIDFYVNEVSLAGYRGTTSVADSINEEGVNLFPNGGTVPFNEDGYIKVIMRCYFDGALQDEKGNAYVNSFYVKQDGVVFGVEFRAVEINS